MTYDCTHCDRETEHAVTARQGYRRKLVCRACGASQWVYDRDPDMDMDDDAEDRERMTR